MFVSYKGRAFLKTELSNAMAAAGDKAQYDIRAKRLLAQKSILARILLKTVEAFKGMSPEDVADCIEGEPVIGMVPIEPYDWKGNINLLNIILIGITDELPAHDERYELHRLIGALLSSSIELNEKLEIMEREYNLPVNSDFRRDVNVMCNLSEGVEEKATERATRKANERVIMNMYKNGYTNAQIAKIVELGVSEIEAIIKEKEPIQA